MHKGSTEALLEAFSNTFARPSVLPSPPSAIAFSTTCETGRLLAFTLMPESDTQF